MHLIQLLNFHQSFFKHTINVAVNHCIKEAENRYNKPDEPDYIAVFVVESMPLIFTLWQKIFNSHNIKSSFYSIFCHQSPKVKFKNINKSNIEIGDLLLIHKHTTRNKQSFHNALLLQAKVLNKKISKLKKSELDQLKLYQEWPKFKYDSPQKLSGISREVIPNLLHSGAQYLSLLKSNGSMSDFYESVPNQHLYANKIFSDAFFDFMINKSGKKFIDKSKLGRNINWSKIIWDLVDLTASSTFTKNNMNYRNQGRQKYVSFSNSEDANSFLAQVLADFSEQPVTEDNNGSSRIHDYKEMDLPEEGIPMIVLETLESEENT